MERTCRYGGQDWGGASCQGPPLTIRARVPPSGPRSFRPNYPTCIDRRKAWIPEACATASYQLDDEPTSLRYYFRCYYAPDLRGRGPHGVDRTAWSGLHNGRRITSEMLVIALITGRAFSSALSLLKKWRHCCPSICPSTASYWADSASLPGRLGTAEQEWCNQLGGVDWSTRSLNVRRPHGATQPDT